ncbi:hypothetical protein QCA50_017934 [Cerrena zonata]|uniref:Uncharacterized protein n=1 Tax=Cerrena zonata TaxID=2478898 RepID=A0AAW0FNN1_9APHY
MGLTIPQLHESRNVVDCFCALQQSNEELVAELKRLKRKTRAKCVRPPGQRRSLKPSLESEPELQPRSQPGHEIGTWTSSFVNGLKAFFWPSH